MTDDIASREVTLPLCLGMIEMDAGVMIEGAVNAINRVEPGI